MNKRDKSLPDQAGQLEAVLKTAGILKGYTVLDFGCHKGNYTIPAAEIVGKDGTVYAVDKYAENLEEVMKRAERAGLRNVRMINTSGKLRLPLKDGEADAVLLYDVIHLVGKNDSSTRKDRESLYMEISRIAGKNALVSVYPKHLKTHTDITSVEEAKREISGYFMFEKRIMSIMLHDEKFEKGEILNFRKAG